MPLRRAWPCDTLRSIAAICFSVRGYREVVAGFQVSPPPACFSAGPLGKAVADLQRLLGAVIELEDSAGQRLKRSGWTRKQAFWPPDRPGGRASAMARARFLRTEARRQRISRR